MHEQHNSSGWNWFWFGTIASLLLAVLNQIFNHGERSASYAILIFFVCFLTKPAVLGCRQGGRGIPLLSLVGIIYIIITALLLRAYTLNKSQVRNSLDNYNKVLQEGGMHPFKH